MFHPLKPSRPFWLTIIFLLWITSAHPTCLSSRYTQETAILSNGIGTLGFSLSTRDISSFWFTKTFGLPTWFVTKLIPLYSYMLLQQFHDSSLISTKPSLKDKHMQHFSTVLRRVLIILMLFISGNVHPNPGPAIHGPTVSNLSFNDFCDRKSLGFLHVNICSLLPKHDYLKSWVHTANPDVLAVSESWLKKGVSDLEIRIPGYVFRQDRSTKGGGMAIFVKDHLQCSVTLSKSVPKQFELLLLKIKLSTNFTLSVAVCYRPPSAPACTLRALGELLAPHISSEFVLLGDLNWNMINPPDLVTQQFDALNLFQIVSEPTRYNLKSPSSATLIDIILTNTPSNYRSGVFSQDLSDHRAIACIRFGLSVKRPPVIVTKRSLKNFANQAFLQDVAAASWERINLIPSVEDA
ncbi:uncharacterized protein LOC116383988 [Anarrhichthys ocellatus]|uniref:uncharacterized protein LOC116383988 n=1 Tax=Anarrhichthys ocellatus TaxID=433405 RepID=UPI0012ED234D|nr:uncharacterized protein LOC116383988 [Anarrhichthys ocellatus]